MAVSQLSREVEKRENKKPQLSDLRESGSIEQDADLVLLLYRQDYYENIGAKVVNKRPDKYGPSESAEGKSKEEQKRALEALMPGDASTVEVIIAKNRNGKTGRVALHFFKSYGRFDNPTKEYEEALAKIEAQSDGE